MIICFSQSEDDRSSAAEETSKLCIVNVYFQYAENYVKWFAIQIVNISNVAPASQYPFWCHKPWSFNSSYTLQPLEFTVNNSHWFPSSFSCSFAISELSWFFWMELLMLFVLFYKFKQMFSGWVVWEKQLQCVTVCNSATCFSAEDWRFPTRNLISRKQEIINFAISGSPFIVILNHAAFQTYL